MFRSKIDVWVGNGLRAALLVACSLVLWIVLFLGQESWPAISSLGTRMVSDASWHPAATADAGTFGLMPIILGTILVTLGALLVAAPLGVAAALFCEFYAPTSLAILFQRFIELLAGIPSVVFGLWGLMVLAPMIARLSPPGQSLLAGTTIVALMILPTVMLLTRSAIASVPGELVQGAVALGMGRLSVIRYIIVPASRGGIAAGVMLGGARALRETMAVVMVCGNVVRVPASIFDPVRTLTANMALEMGYALGLHRSVLFASGLMLMLASIVIVGVLHLFSRPQAK